MSFSHRPIIFPALRAKQAKFSKSDPKIEAEISEKLARFEQEILELETRWKVEKEIVQELLATRTRSINDAFEAPKAATSLADIETRLKAVQSESPLVYPEVGEAIVATIVSEWTGIPVGRMVKDDIAAVLDLSAR